MRRFQTMMGGCAGVLALTMACGKESSTDTGSDPTTTAPATTAPATDDDPSEGTTAGAPRTTGAEGTTASPSDTTGAATEAATDTDAPVYFDLGGIPEAPMSEGPCGKVDFLFVIDNSGSMLDEQVALVNSFPGFITAIQSTLETVQEYNVGVVTSDAYSPNVASPGCNVLGGLVVQTGGGGSSNMVCGPYDAGDNYMTQNDDLGTAFACAAQVGTSGSGIELMISAMLNAVDPTGPLAAPGACNEGFMREDALLVVVLITDEYDGPGDPESGPSPGTPMEWHDSVVAAKGGIPENVVVVSLVNWMGGPCPPTSTVYDGVNLVEFTNYFGDNGLVGGICEADYSPIFAEAVGIIDVACDNFVPPN